MKTKYYIVFVTRQYRYDHNDERFDHIAYDDVSRKFDSELDAEKCLEELFQQHAAISEKRITFYRREDQVRRDPSVTRMSVAGELASMVDEIQKLETDFLVSYGLSFDQLRELSGETHFQIQKRYTP